jgi:hypothetical protein
LEELLLQPPYASFIEAAMAISDICERGGLPPPATFVSWCRNVTTDILGSEAEVPECKPGPNDVPMVLNMAIDAVIDGMAVKDDAPLESQTEKGH